MKRFVVILILLLAVVARADSPYSATYTLTSDTAVTIAAAYAAGGGATLPTSQPKSVTLQAETNGIRVAFRQVPSVDNVGAFLDAGSSIRWEGPNAYVNGKICNKTAGSNAKVHIILGY